MAAANRAAPLRAPDGWAPGGVLDDLPDGALVLSAAGRVLAANLAAQRVFGYTRDELLSKGIGEITNIETAQLESEAPLDALGRHKSGRQLGLELTWSTRATGRGVRHTAVVRDVTDRRQSDRAAQHRAAELEAFNDELSLLYRISSALIRATDLHQLLAAVLENIIDNELLTIQGRGSVFLLEGDRMRLAAHVGHSDAFVTAHDEMRVGECLCGQVALNGEVSVSACHRGAAPCAEHCLDHAPHGHIILPLKAARKTVGVLCLSTPASAGTVRLSAPTLEAMGNQIGMAVENARLYEQTRELSLHDPLTGLANRRLMHLFLERHFAAAQRRESQFSVIMLDIDHFKRFNDQHGHVAGDRVLRNTATAIRETIRDADLGARYGGEEFLVLLPNTPLHEAIEAAERLRRSVAHRTPITASLGVASYRRSAGNMEGLIRQADEALYRAKRQGRNRVEVSGATQRRVPVGSAEMDGPPSSARPRLHSLPGA